MAVLGRYQMYYNKIKENLIGIQEEYGYSNLSKSFAHWYLKKTLHYDEQQLAETLIDGDGDNGIDAIVVEGETMILYQFKFPDKAKNIDKDIDERTVLKMFNGYNKLLSNRRPMKANENFMKFRDQVKEESIFNYRFCFVAFLNGFSVPAEDALKLRVGDIYETTGNNICIGTVLKKRVCDMYDRFQKKNRLDVEMSYNRLETSYNLGEEVSSYVGFTNARDILKACSPHMDIIFDENIRLYEGDNPVNQGIYETATTEESRNFFFYHNGVVFICDKCKNSTGNQNVYLEGVSVVNGCQTINALNKAKEDKKLKDDIFIQFRIIETSDFDLRSKITEYLNSQTKIKDSYFLANDPFVRALQTDLLEKGYFLERLINEYSYKRALEKVEEYDRRHILILEKTVQIYAAYYHNDYAPRAKRGKSELFDKRVVDKIIGGISADKVIWAVCWYEKIEKVIRLYRRCRRTDHIVMDFFEYLDMEVSEEEYEEKLAGYAFMNTADLLILNTVANLEKHVIYEEPEEYILEAIEICRNAVEQSGLLPYRATKSNQVFEAIQNDINHQEPSAFEEG